MVFSSSGVCHFFPVGGPGEAVFSPSKLSCGFRVAVVVVFENFLGEVLQARIGHLGTA